MFAGFYNMGPFSLVTWQIIYFVLTICLYVASVLYEVYIMGKGFLRVIINTFLVIAIASMAAAYLWPGIPVPWHAMVDSGHGRIVTWQAVSLFLVLVLGGLSAIYHPLADIDEMMEELNDGEAKFILIFLRKGDFTLLCMFIIFAIVSGGVVMRSALYFVRSNIHIMQELSTSDMVRVGFMALIGLGLVYVAVSMCYLAVSQIVRRIRERRVFGTLHLLKLFLEYDNDQFKFIQGEKDQPPYGVIVLFLWLLLLIIALVSFMQVVDIPYGSLLFNGESMVVMWIIFTCLCFIDVLVCSLSATRSELKETIKSIQIAERSKIDVIAGAMHDIKTPITKICNYSKDTSLVSLQGEAAECIEIITRNAGHLKDMIKAVADASHASTPSVMPKIENVCITDMLLYNLSNYEDEFRAKDITIMYPDADDPVYTNTDSRMLQSILDNVIGNASRYAVDGTRLFVEIKQNRQIPSIIVTNVSAGGIDSEDNLVQPYYLGKNAKRNQGSGLGLYTAKNYMEKLGRFRITADGDIFKVTLVFDHKNPKASSIIALAKEPARDYLSVYDGQMIETTWYKADQVYGYPASAFLTSFKLLPNMSDIKQWLGKFKKTKPHKSQIPTSDLVKITSEIASEYSNIFQNRGINLVFESDMDEDVDENLLVYANEDDLRAMLRILIKNAGKRAPSRTNIFVLVTDWSTDMVDLNGSPGVIIKAIASKPITPDNDDLAADLLPYSNDNGIEDERSIVEGHITSMGGGLLIQTSGDAFMIKAAFPGTE